ncbi:MAG: hypothetical protein U0176_24635 [Bacteroidia bacterium]
MKTDQSIQSIALASVRRHSMDMETWTRTAISQALLMPSTDTSIGELPVVQLILDEFNWTQVTTRRVVGAIDGEIREVEFRELENCRWGFFKDPNSDRTRMQLKGRLGTQLEFWIETGKPSMAMIYAVMPILKMYRGKS